MTTFDDILKKILEQKRAQVNARKLLLDQLTIEDRILQGLAPALRPFIQSLQSHVQNDGIAIISELKKASPSKGLLCEDYHPEKIASNYEQHGAACLSVLTETDFFLGKDEDLIAAKSHCSLPVLRKDFIIDPYQIYESRYLGADCILLIVAALSTEQVQEYYQLARELNLDVLIEVNNEEELTVALSTPATLIGINNRNLKDFSVELDRTISLSQQVPSNRMVICESGIRSRDDIEYMQKHHVDIFLIGETLMRCDSPGEMLQILLNKEEKDT